ncbi:MAG: hypothetical protein COA96_04840 [SAR86 cluster bacterium]|uniref:Flagellar protein FliL n=1 Tax=SAR86 cluster bacterium TaxID=2030880 RepID=A0A2A5B534_9GAMM|nr:MAG: hypothetical protein COA96_04840 [SAR86 cluster bacterium]
MSKKKIFWFLVLLAGAAGPTYQYGYLPSLKQSTEGVEAASIGVQPRMMSNDDFIYMPINPPFVVNFTHLGALRYLQISLEVMYSDQHLLDQVQEHMPAIRNSLILLLSDQPFEKLSTFDGKQELREEMMLAVNDIIANKENFSSPGQMFITNFVMQ